MTERTALLSWISRIGPAGARSVAVRFGCTESSARARLGAGERDGQLRRSRPLADGPSLYALTRNGMRAAGVPEREPARVTAAGARHMTICAEVAAALEVAYGPGCIIGERELRQLERRYRERLASVAMGGAAAGEHRPDLVLRRAGTGAVAVEVELTLKAPRRLAAICGAWARARHVGGVLYLYAPEVGPALERAVAAAGAQQAITMRPLSDVLEIE
jgi:hypothetical protein